MNAVRVAVAALVVAAPMFGGSSAYALAGSPPPTVALQYVRAANTKECLEERELRGRMTADLGYDPFAAPTAGAQSETLRIRFERQRGLLTADLELLNPQGRTVAEQRLRSNDPTCAGLGSAVEVAVSVMFDRVEEAPKAKPSEDQLLALSPLPVITLPPEPPPRKVPVHFTAGLVAAFAKEVTPQPAVLLSVRWPTWSLELEGRHEFYEPYGALPSYSSGPPLVSQRDILTAGPCLWSGIESGVAFCPVLIGGVRRLTGTNGGDTASLGILAAGARLAVSVPLLGPVSVRVQGGLVFPLLGGSATVNGFQIIEDHSAYLDLGVGLSVQVF